MYNAEKNILSKFTLCKWAQFVKNGGELKQSCPADN